MISFNYRVIVRNDPDLLYSLHEVYYAPDGTVENWTERPFAVGDSMDELKREYEHMGRAFAQPVLSLDDLTNRRA